MRSLLSERAGCLAVSLPILPLLFTFEVKQLPKTLYSSLYRLQMLHEIIITSGMRFQGGRHFLHNITTRVFSRVPVRWGDVVLSSSGEATEL